MQNGLCLINWEKNTVKNPVEKLRFISEILDLDFKCMFYYKQVYYKSLVIDGLNGFTQGANQCCLYICISVIFKLELQIGADCFVS